MGSPWILVVEDELSLARVVAKALQYEGFTVTIAGTAREALDQVTRTPPDLVVLDVMLPDGSGIHTCERFRAAGCDTPVVFLTALDDSENKLAGLSAGDDYVTKPFSLAELIARIRAVLRRDQRTRARAGTPPLRYADLELDEDAHEVRRGGELVELTATEFKVLHYLLVNAERVVSRAQIFRAVWDFDAAGRDGVVATHISYLRRKMDERDPPLIHTIPRVGYVLRLPRGQ